MDANGFIEDERGVTPVIGIILIVAIAVVLAAVVGTSLIDTGNKSTTTAPQVSFEFDYDADGPTLEVTHRSGDPVENPSTVLAVAGDESPSIDTIEDGGDDELNSGDTIVIDLDGELSDGDEVRVVWEDAETDTTTVIGRYEFGG